MASVAGLPAVPSFQLKTAPTVQGSHQPLHHRFRASPQFLQTTARFEDLELLKSIGEGSFGRVSPWLLLLLTKGAQEGRGGESGSTASTCRCGVGCNGLFYGRSWQVLIPCPLPGAHPPTP